ncbi:MAG: MauE/DoxX family redox-associated membrane protein [Verrucomicrobiales bacterium]
MSDRTLAYTLARVGLGVNLACHGAVRIPKLESFAKWMTGLFADSWLPAFLVTPFAWLLPFVELALGLAILLGWQSRRVLAGASALMVMLIFGSCLIENWSAAGSQMIYLAFSALLLAFREAGNGCSLDEKLAK